MEDRAGIAQIGQILRLVRNNRRWIRLHSHSISVDRPTMAVHCHTAGVTRVLSWLCHSVLCKLSFLMRGGRVLGLCKELTHFGDHTLNEQSGRVYSRARWEPWQIGEGTPAWPRCQSIVTRRQCQEKVARSAFLSQKTKIIYILYKF